MSESLLEGCHRLQEDNSGETSERGKFQECILAS